MKEIWLNVGLLNVDDLSFIVRENKSIDVLLCNVSNYEKTYKQFGDKYRYALFIESNDQSIKFNKNLIYVSSETDRLKELSVQGATTGFYQKIFDGQTMDRSWSEGLNYPYLLTEFTDTTNIPLELIIAKKSEAKSSTKIIKFVNNVDDACVACQVLEKGADGVILNGVAGISNDEIYKINQKHDNVELKVGKVNSLQYIGIGDRGCIDTTSMMTQTEGMIIGSTSHGGIFVCSETHYLPYMNLRPFRVNAGAVHSYVICENNTTKYISELKSGDRVLCINDKGEARVVTVGRNKIEKRPLIKIEADFDGIVINTIVQDDWHVRIMGKNAIPKNVTDLKVGEEILGYVTEGGRHVGIKVNEMIIEY